MIFKENTIIHYNDMNVIKVQYIQHYLLQNNVLKLLILIIISPSFCKIDLCIIIY